MAATVQLPSFTIPSNAVNPYEWVQQELVAQMYPAWAPGYRARYITLLTVLAANIALSLLYVMVYSADLRRKGRQVWCWRIVQRPAGRYLILNQYISYPVTTIVLSTLWITLVTHLWDLFGSADHADPASLFFYIALSWIPYFISAWGTTFACLSSANLTSKGARPNSHRLSPLLANTLLIALPLAMAIAIVCAGVWTGIKWRIFAESWNVVYRRVGEEAARWTGTADPTRDQQLGALIMERWYRFTEFRSSQRICAAIYCISAAVLIVINVTGGVSLLATLRSLGRADDRIILPHNEPVVAPLPPFVTGPSPLDTSGATTMLAPFEDGKVSDNGEKEERERDAWDQESVAEGLRRLEWDVVLFFVAVVPSCLLFIIFSAWMANNLDRVFSDARLYEFSTQGIIFIFACTSFLSLLALTIKTSLSLCAGRPRLVDETTEANLRRRQSRCQTGVLPGVVVIEWKEVESEVCSLDYRSGTWGGSTTKGSLG